MNINKMTTVGVSGVVINRIFDMYTSIFGNQNELPKKNIVVIGYGWAGKSFCDNINTKKYDVKVISKTNYMLNTPQLKNSLIDKESELLKIKPTKNNVEFINDECNEIIKARKTVVSNNKYYDYDYLVVATGSEINDFGIPGIKEYCHFLKNEDDLKKLSTNLKVKGEFNYADNHIVHNQKIVIMGGGPVGIELAFELSKINKNIIILEGLNTILPNFSDEARNIVLKELEESGIKLLLNNKVNKVDSSKIYSDEKSEKREYNYDIAIWNCGIKPNKLISNITHQNKLVTYDNFRIHNIDGELNLNERQIYAIGDMSGKMPPTAQNAVQQGKYLAEYFNNNLEGKDYKFNEKGKIIHTKNSIILDTSYGVFNIPKFFETPIEYMLC